jgi:hypothetical protein
MTDAPALVQNGRLDILAANRLGQALYSELYLDPTRPVNHARFIFFDPRARDFYPDWDRAANDGVALLRAEAGRNPYDRGLTDLVGERRRPQPHVRAAGTRRRPGPEPPRVQRRARFEVRRGTGPPRELGSDARPSRTRSCDERNVSPGRR